MMLVCCVGLWVTPAYAQETGDAIAIRVEKNPDLLSASQWYAKKGFRGRPQSIVVDGYAGVRDGRTVYVNAANVGATAAQIAAAKDDAALGAIPVYANIYMLSYSNDATPSTQDIFGRMLSRWSFNANLKERSGTCQGNAVPANRYCLIDKDCPSGSYCNSLKARLTRDIRRINDLSNANLALETYSKEHNSTVPTLVAGSYIKGLSLSVWPSWLATLAIDLGADLPLDPVNKLSVCAAPYNSLTCWAEKTRAFDFNSLKGARIYAYKADEVEKFCTFFESPFNLSDWSSKKCGTLR